MPVETTTSDTRAPASALAGAATAVVTGIAALTLTGSLGRVQRNHGSEFAFVLGVVVVGAGLYVVGHMARSDRTTVPSALRWGGVGMLFLGSALALRLTLFSLLGADLRWWFVTAGVVVVIGAALFVAAAVNASVSSALEWTGVIVLVLAIASGFALAVVTANDPERPSVALALDDATLSARGTAEVADLSSEDRLAVNVYGLRLGKGHTLTDDWPPLTSAVVGPDSDGNAIAHVTAQVPPGRYDAIGLRGFTASREQDCDYRRKDARAAPAGTGCATVMLPQRPAHPELAATWDRGALKVSWGVDNVPTGGSNPGVVALQIVGIRAGTPVALYRAMATPAAHGATRRELTLPIARQVRMVCAEAEVVETYAPIPGVACPIASSVPGTAMIELRVPDPAAPL